MKNLKQKIIYNANSIVRRNLRPLVLGRSPYQPMTMEIANNSNHTDNNTQQRPLRRSTNSKQNEMDISSKSENRPLTGTEESLKSISPEKIDKNTTRSTSSTSTGTGTGSLELLGKSNLTDNHTEKSSESRATTVAIANKQNDAPAREIEENFTAATNSYTHNIVGGIIQQGSTDNGEIFTVIQDGTEYDAADKFMCLQVSFNLKNFDLSMLTNETHTEGADDSVEQ